MGWIRVFENIGDKMPEKDCDIWVTRRNCFGDRWVQKIPYYADQKEVEIF